MKSEKGIITLEACVTVLLFMVLMLFLSGIYTMYMAQNATAHALLQTSQSLALDNYSGTVLKVWDSSGGKAPESVQSFLLSFLRGKGSTPLIPAADAIFSTNENWTKDETTTQEMVKRRFVAYLANGDENEADTILKNMNVVDGLSGLDFTETKVQGENLDIVLKYQMDYEFQLGTIGRVDVYQESSSKLWK